LPPFWCAESDEPEAWQTFLHRVSLGRIKRFSLSTLSDNIIIVIVQKKCIAFIECYYHVTIDVIRY
jgi:hypothetical protein